MTGDNDSIASYWGESEFDTADDDDDDDYEVL